MRSDTTAAAPTGRPFKPFLTPSPLHPCPPAWIKKLSISTRRPAIGSALFFVGGPDSGEHTLLSNTQHLERRYAHNTTRDGIRAAFEGLSSPLLFLQINVAADHVLAHVPLHPPTIHRPIAIVVKPGVMSGERLLLLRSRLRRNGFAHQCLSEADGAIVSTSVCPVPRTEMRFNSVVGGLFREGHLRGGSVLDAGANTGEFACYYAVLDPKRKVQAFDASAQYVNHIHNTYPRITNLRANLRGLGSATGVMGGKTVQHRRTTTAAATQLCEGGADELLPNGSVSGADAVAVCRVDDLYAKQPLAFAHWDVEGFELNVLRGARAVVRRDRPIFSLELHVHEDPSYTQALLGLVEELGYDAHLIEERCGARADCRNLLCTPTEQRGAMLASATMQRAATTHWLLPTNRSSITSLAYPCCAEGGACPSCSPTEVNRWLDTQVRLWQLNGSPVGLDPRSIFTSEPWDRTADAHQMDIWAEAYSRKGGNRLALVAGGGSNASTLGVMDVPAPYTGCTVNVAAAEDLLGLPADRRPADWMPILFVHIHANATSLKPLEDCAIRSAARHNPRFQVLVVSSTLQPRNRVIGDADSNRGFALFPTDGAMASLRFPPRCVRLRSFDAAFNGTNLDSWYQQHGRDKTQKHLIVILADVLRMALLFKIGGAYLDLDMVSLAPLPPAPTLEHGIGLQLHGVNQSGVGFRTQWQLNNAALLFRCPRSPILSAVMANFVRKYEPHLWGTGGPVLYTRVWKAWRDRKVAEYAAVDNLTVLPYKAFYPIHWWDRKAFHAPEGESKAALEPGVTVGVHLWNHMYNNGTTHPWRRDSFAARLVRAQCDGWAPTGDR